MSQTRQELQCSHLLTLSPPFNLQMKKCFQQKTSSARCASKALGRQRKYLGKEEPLGLCTPPQWGTQHPLLTQFCVSRAILEYKHKGAVREKAFIDKCSSYFPPD